MRNTALSALLLAASTASAAPAAPTAPAAAPRPRIEVAFVLDATGSMGPYIDDARARIRSIADDLSKGEPRPEVRYALVAYRDKGDDFVTQITPFTSDVGTMHGALNALSANGGGDTPEAVLEALRDGILKLRWTPVPRNTEDENVLRLLYLVGDAEPHVYPDSPKEADLSRAALERHIAVQSLICGNPGTVGRTFFERVAARSEGRAVALERGAARAAAAAADLAGGPGGSGGAGVGAAVSGTTRTYASDVLRVDFRGAAPSVTVAPLKAPEVAESGLLGPQLRLVPNATALSDLWRAHTSLGADASPPPPVVDFSKQQVIAAGGADVGLAVRTLRFDEARGVRVAVVGPATPGVRFYVVPAAPQPVIVGEE